MLVKMRKVGNSWTLTVPDTTKEERNKYYETYKGNNGAIVFIPHRANPFESNSSLKKYGEYDGDNTGFVDGGANDKELQ